MLLCYFHVILAKMPNCCGCFLKKNKTICLFCQLPPHLFPFEVKILPGKTWLNIETQFIDSVSEGTGHTQIRLGNTPIG